MRVLVAIAAAGILVGASAGASFGSVSMKHVRELLVGIFDDVAAIVDSFHGGPDNPASPVSNPATLNDDAARLNSASRKSQDLAVELNRIKDEPSGNGH